MIRLETERLLLADWQPEDWLAFRPIATDPDVMRYIGPGVPWEDERIRCFVEAQTEYSANLGFWKLIEKSTGSLIGFCGLQPLSDTPDIEIGWWLAKTYWGQGLATEAATAALHFGFESAGLRRIIAIAQPANHVSVRIMKKLGMVFERELVRDGIPIVLYAIDNPARPSQET